ncbi:MAG: BppU family phage baseplate upper protein [Ruminococcus sp.]|nr:BppU family phage baseplate upper protein [Ruminococcus sp.]
MITHNTAITLDINTEGLRAEVWAKQDDVQTRTVTASFVNNGAALTLASVSSAELRVLRPDGKMVTSAATISGDTVIAEFPENALSVGGDGYGDIRLLDGNGACISAARFILHVEHAAVSNEAVSQTSEFAALLQGIYDRLGGMSLAKMTREEYDAAQIHFTSTLYAVTDENGKVTLYLGDTELKSGTAMTDNTSAVPELLSVGRYIAVNTGDI